MLIGAHVSAEGGVQNAPGNGEKLGCEVIQIFSKSQLQWAAKPLSPEACEGFKSGVKSRGLGPSLVHCSYLLNCASIDEALFEKSWKGLQVEIERAAQLDIPYIVFHPGSPKEKGSEWGCRRVASAVSHAVEATRGANVTVLLEINAGAGAAVGRTFEELALMLRDLTADKSRVAVCIDTCHAFVGGYPIHTEEGYEETMDRFKSTVGLSNLKAFHLNDSKAGLGSNLDRHENLGKGLMGDIPFWKLMTDKRFAKIPGYLETPLGEEGYPADLKRLRDLRDGKLKPKPAPKVGQMTLGGDVAPKASKAPEKKPTSKKPGKK